MSASTGAWSTDCDEWLRASGTRWKEIFWEVGRVRAGAHEHWLYAALCVIAWRLNVRERPKHIDHPA